MSDITDTTATEPADQDTTGTETEPTETTEQTTDLAQELAKWKAQARENEKRAKANAEKAKQYDAFEESQKTETQKALDRAAEAEKRATEAEQRAIKSDIARDKGVPVELLAGTTAEELQASADALLAFRGTQAQAARVGGADISGGPAKPTIYSREQIQDPAFYKAHRDDILLAQRQGRIN